MNASPVVLGIDGNSIAHRAFHAYENRPGNTNDPYDRPLSATYGFLALLAGIADKVRSRYGRLDAVIVGFDDPHSSQRRDRYPDYKAHRPAKDPSLVAQLETIPDIVRRLGVTVITPTGLEADDVIASVAATAEQHGHRVVLATSDRDAFSQISPTTTVLRLASGLDQAVWLDPDTLHDTYGIWPAAYPLYAAMRGDSSDNLPGIPGVGEKRAAALVAAYTTVDEMLADPDGCRKILGPKATGALFDETGQQAVRRNLDLMTQLRDLPIDLDASVLTGNAADHQQVCADIGHPKLADRVSAALLNVTAAAAADQEIEALAEADLRYSGGYRDALDDLNELYGDEFDETAAPTRQEPEEVPFAAAGSTNRQSSGQLDLF